LLLLGTDLSIQTTTQSFGVANSRGAVILAKQAILIGWSTTSHVAPMITRQWKMLY
jgi:hypothetical protein